MTGSKYIVPPKGEVHQSTVVDELGQEKVSAGPLSVEEAPDGGIRAWLVAAGGASVFFCCLGFANSFGTFEEYYLSHQLRGQSPDNVAWIGSISAFLQFASSAVGGPLFDRYGAWVCFFAGPALSAEMLT
jgi:hypothetical protein